MKRGKVLQKLVVKTLKHNHLLGSAKVRGEKEKKSTTVAKSATNAVFNDAKKLKTVSRQSAVEKTNKSSRATMYFHFGICT